MAARLQSFKLAAQELSVTPTTVSNQIRKLERDWGCQLFIRKTRQLVLTEVGRSLAQTVNRAFGDIKAEIEAHVTMAKKQSLWRLGLFCITLAHPTTQSLSSAAS